MILILLLFLLFAPVTYAQESPEDTWPMVGQDVERSSRSNVAITESLSPEWYKPIEPYISQKVQIIAANDTLFISTARGLYALDSSTGADKWVYPTQLPLGHSPTYDNGVVYVGGFDHKLHAINATNGQGLWTFEAGQGFQTNPLVVNNIVYAGNRDGHMYAVNSSNGTLAWKFKTNGPVLFSAAYSDNVIYFASNDSYAYAVNATTGALIWKSQKLPGAGFHSWWPVVYTNPADGKKYVIFSGSENREMVGHAHDEWNEVYPLRQSLYSINDMEPVGPTGNEPGPWPSGTTTIDTSQPYIFNGTIATKAVTKYLEEKPHRRTYFVLDSVNGQEVTYDFNNNGQPEYAPILWQGTQSGNRFPPIAAPNGLLYQASDYLANSTWIPSGHVVAWKFGTPYLGVISQGRVAVDEPTAYSMGGNVIYWSLCCDRWAASIDTTTSALPTWLGGVNNPNREVLYFGYNLSSVVPNYNVQYGSGPSDVARYGGINGVYGNHGNQNPPIPYKGKVYIHRSNAIIAFSPGQKTAQNLGLYQTVSPQSSTTLTNITQLKTKLDSEIQKMINAGHLRPGHSSTGIDDYTAGSICGENLFSYFHNPSDTIYTLLSALPHVSDSLKQPLRTYIQQEFNAYPLYQFTHIGYSGAKRETFDTPPELQSYWNTQNPQQGANWSGWNYNPFMFYTLWKYAQEFGDAANLFNLSKDKLNPTPNDSLLSQMPFVHNAYISGLIGYIELGKLAGFTESSPELVNQVAERDRLLNLRKTNFNQYASQTVDIYCRAYTVAKNFLYLAPELAQYLKDNIPTTIQDAVSYYNNIAPYWFVSRTEEGFQEGVIRNLYDYSSLFQAKALILKQPYEELVKYLDVPAFERGDLFYIQNLVSAIEAAPQSSCTLVGDIDCSGVVNVLDLSTLIGKFGGSDISADLDNSGKVNVIDLSILLSNFGKASP